MSKKEISLGSKCVLEPSDLRTTQPNILPLYATSSFAFNDVESSIAIFSGEKTGHVYGRYANPTIDSVAAKIAQLESHQTNLTPTAYLTSSGMSAISTLMMGLLKQGDGVLTQGNLYGGTTELLLKVLQPLGIQVHFCDLKNLALVEDYLRDHPAIKLVYGETPANPTMACIDLKAIASLAKKYSAHSAIDNTFCTPYLQRPLSHGIDFVIHSTTKFLNGHGNGIAGAIIGSDQQLMHEKVWTCLKLAGTNCNPWDAWLINNGIKTLALRMEQHGKNAQALAEFLEQHAKVSRVNYNGLTSHPDHLLAKSQMSGFGGMLSFELKDGMQAGIDLMNKLKLATLAPTLGDVHTLALHPASSSHLNVDKTLREKNGISDGMVRISVGIESSADIIADFDQALA